MLNSSSKWWWSSGWEMIYARRTLWSRVVLRTGTKGSLPGGPRLRMCPHACGDPLVAGRNTTRDQCSLSNQDTRRGAPGNINPGPMPHWSRVIVWPGQKGWMKALFSTSDSIINYVISRTMIDIYIFKYAISILAFSIIHI